MGKDSNDYLPFYAFQPVSVITDIWTEWSSGLNGFLAVRDLEETWGARWRRNNAGLKTEMGRRKKVIQLVEKLAAKPNWNTALALRFIQTTCERKWTVRKFCVHLQKAAVSGGLSALDELIVAADSYAY